MIRTSGIRRAQDPSTKAADNVNLQILRPSPRLADRIYERVLAQIVSGEFAVGGRLPAENVLGTQYRVSRAVVREALSRLYADGVVVTRRGSGTFVRRKPGREFLRLAPIGGIADLMRCYEFRIALEGEAAHLAAQRRTEEHMAAVNNAFEKMVDADTRGETSVEADINFHVSIARASRNQMFVQTLDALAVHMMTGMDITYHLPTARDRKRLLLVQEEHRSILEAIRAGDVELARAVMRRHIDNARDRALDFSTEP